jgi:hypothetical protein
MTDRTRPRSTQPAGIRKALGGRRGKRLAALAVAGAAAVAVPATAFAAVPQGSSAPVPSRPAKHAARSCSAASFPTSQRDVEAQLSVRTAALGALQTEVDAAGSLSAADRSALLAELSATSATIGQLSTTAGSATTCAQLGTVERAMVQTRVFGIVTTKVRLTIAADRAAAAEAVAAKLEPFAQQAIDAVASTGTNVSAARSSYTKGAAGVTAAVAATNGVAASVLAVSPTTTWDAKVVFSHARDSLRTARRDLTAARRDLQASVGDLRRAR